MSQQDTAYTHLRELSRYAQTLNSINHLLHWDQETHMPPGGASLRAEQLKVMAGLIHRAKTGTPFREALATLVDLDSGEVYSDGLTAVQEAALRRWHRDWKRENVLPETFVEEFAALTSEAIEVWKEARRHDNYAAFAPYLEKIISYNRRKADYIGYSQSPYDALLEEYEPEMTTAEVSAIFDALRTPITELLHAINRQPQVDTSCLQVGVAEETQLSFGKQLLQSIGFDFAKGNLSLSTHPFCQALHPHDCRITTRIKVNDPMGNIGTLLHEGGHALYEMHLPASEYGTPLGEALSLGMHESQSRWWETYIGQSKPFWEHFLPQLHAHCGPHWPPTTLDAFWKAINKVEPSFIRVEADEVTYPLHVILRFELERDLIEGKLSVADLPAAWNAKMDAFLGIVPPSERLGCLQDVHWAMGAFGYFPTYLLGNTYAAYLFDVFTRTYPGWSERVAKGELHFIAQWLKEQVHHHGRRYSSRILLEHVGEGAPFNEKPYLRYLTDKYSAIYQLPSVKSQAS